MGNSPWIHSHFIPSPCAGSLRGDASCEELGGRSVRKHVGRGHSRRGDVQCASGSGASVRQSERTSSCSHPRSRHKASLRCACAGAPSGASSWCSSSHSLRARRCVPPASFVPEFAGCVWAAQLVKGRFRGIRGSRAQILCLLRPPPLEEVLLGVQELSQGGECTDGG